MRVSHRALIRAFCSYVEYAETVDIPQKEEKKTRKTLMLDVQSCSRSYFRKPAFTKRWQMKRKVSKRTGCRLQWSLLSLTLSSISVSKRPAKGNAHSCASPSTMEKRGKHQLWHFCLSHVWFWERYALLIAPHLPDVFICCNSSPCLSRTLHVRPDLCTKSVSMALCWILLSLKHKLLLLSQM